MVKRILIVIAGLLIAIPILLVIYYQFTTPTNDGVWKPEYERLASVDINGDQITIRNLRRARYDLKGHPENIDWTERTVNLANLKDAWFGISVFASPGLAHTFLSFDFGDGDPVVISVEARQQPDQGYSPWAGALDNYNLIYVIADERDIIGVRTHAKHQQVFFQPLTISRERTQKLFLDMVATANALVETPRFYNTFTSNCTNSILEDTGFPGWRRYFDWRVMLPGFSDRVAYDFGVLDQNYSREELRQAAHLDPAAFALEDPAFSSLVRESFFNQIQQLSLGTGKP